MIVNFAKSLDRPVDIFGIKGKWLTVFLVCAGVALVTALVVGAMTTTGLGIATAILLIVSSFVGCLMLQGKVSHRQLSKYRASSKLPSHVARRETLGRILLPDPRYEEESGVKDKR